MRLLFLLFLGLAASVELHGEQSTLSPGVVFAELAATAEPQAMVVIDRPTGSKYEQAEGLCQATLLPQGRWRLCSVEQVLASWIVYGENLGWEMKSNPRIADPAKFANGWTSTLDRRLGEDELHYTLSPSFMTDPVNPLFGSQGLNYTDPYPICCRPLAEHRAWGSSSSSGVAPTPVMVRDTPGDGLPPAQKEHCVLSPVEWVQLHGTERFDPRQSSVAPAEGFAQSSWRQNPMYEQHDWLFAWENLKEALNRAPVSEAVVGPPPPNQKFRSVRGAKNAAALSFAEMNSKVDVRTLGLYDFCALSPPLHGALGECPIMLPDRESCNFICDPGYVLDGAPSQCMDGVLVSTQTCSVPSLSFTRALVNGVAFGYRVSGAGLSSVTGADINPTLTMVQGVRYAVNVSLWEDDGGLIFTIGELSFDPIDNHCYFSNLDYADTHGGAFAPSGAYAYDQPLRQAEFTLTPDERTTSLFYSDTRNCVSFPINVIAPGSDGALDYIMFYDPFNGGINPDTWRVAEGRVQGPSMCGVPNDDTHRAEVELRARYTSSLHVSFNYMPGRRSASSGIYGLWLKFGGRYWTGCHEQYQNMYDCNVVNGLEIRQPLDEVNHPATIPLSVAGTPAPVYQVDVDVDVHNTSRAGQVRTVFRLAHSGVTVASFARTLTDTELAVFRRQQPDGRWAFSQYNVTVVFEYRPSWQGTVDVLSYTCIDNFYVMCLSSKQCMRHCLPGYAPHSPVSNVDVDHVCLACPAGSFSNGTTPCQLCPVDFYQDEPLSSSCKPCAAGTAQFPGSTACPTINELFSSFPWTDSSSATSAVSNRTLSGDGNFMFFMFPTHRCAVIETYPAYDIDFPFAVNFDVESQAPVTFHETSAWPMHEFALAVDVFPNTTQPAGIFSKSSCEAGGEGFIWELVDGHMYFYTKGSGWQRHHQRVPSNQWTSWAVTVLNSQVQICRTDVALCDCETFYARVSPDLSRPLRLGVRDSCNVFRGQLRNAKVVLLDSGGAPPSRAPGNVLTDGGALLDNVDNILWELANRERQDVSARTRWSTPDEHLLRTRVLAHTRSHIPDLLAPGDLGWSAALAYRPRKQSYLQTNAYTAGERRGTVHAHAYGTSTAHAQAEALLDTTLLPTAKGIAVGLTRYTAKPANWEAPTPSKPVSGSGSGSGNGAVLSLEPLQRSLLETDTDTDANANAKSEAGAETEAGAGAINIPPFDAQLIDYGFLIRGGFVTVIEHGHRFKINSQGEFLYETVPGNSLPRLIPLPTISAAHSYMFRLERSALAVKYFVTAIDSTVEQLIHTSVYPAKTCNYHAAVNFVNSEPLSLPVDPRLGFMETTATLTSTVSGQAQAQRSASPDQFNPVLGAHFYKNRCPEAKPFGLACDNTYMGTDDLYWNSEFCSTRLVSCPSQCNNIVHGTQRYTADSSICTAARHALDINGGSVVLNPMSGYDKFEGTLQNNVQSLPWPGKFPVTFKLYPDTWDTAPYCGEIRAPPNAILNRTCSWMSNYKVCSFGCRTGYEAPALPENSVGLVCRDGEWSGPAPSCKISDASGFVGCFSRMEPAWGMREVKKGGQPQQQPQQRLEQQPRDSWLARQQRRANHYARLAAHFAPHPDHTPFRPPHRRSRGHGHGHPQPHHPHAAGETETETVLLEAEAEAEADVAQFPGTPDAYGVELVNDFVFVGNGHSIESCWRFANASGATHFGLTQGDACYIGSEYEADGAATDCNVPCRAFTDETCGGQWSWSVYDTSVYRPKPLRELPQYIGCFPRSSELSEYPPTQEEGPGGGYTVWSCWQAALESSPSYQYFGLTQGGICLFGNRYHGDAPLAGGPFVCDTQCSAFPHPTITCGSDDNVDVYETFDFKNILDIGVDKAFAYDAFVGSGHARHSVWNQAGVYPGDSMGNRKYDAYNTVPFSVMRLCVHYPDKCMLFAHTKVYENAVELFANGYVPMSPDKALEFAHLWPHEQCPMVTPGFNVQCPAFNSDGMPDGIVNTRWGYCTPAGGVPCNANGPIEPEFPGGQIPEFPGGNVGVVEVQSHAHPRRLLTADTEHARARTHAKASSRTSTNTNAKDQFRARVNANAKSKAKSAARALNPGFDTLALDQMKANEELFEHEALQLTTEDATRRAHLDEQAAVHELARYFAQEQALTQRYAQAQAQAQAALADTHARASSQTLAKSSEGMRVRHVIAQETESVRGVIGLGLDSSHGDADRWGAGWTSAVGPAVPADGNGNGNGAPDVNAVRASIDVAPAARDWSLIMSIGPDATFHYDSLHWTMQSVYPIGQNGQMKDGWGNAKYAGFNSIPFSQIRMCIGNVTNCLTATLSQVYSSAYALFKSEANAEADSVSREEFYRVFDPYTRGYCQPAFRGFNVVCPETEQHEPNAVRWGFCNNAPTVPVDNDSQPLCYEEEDDADGVIGVGLRARSDCCQAGAGYTNLFVYNKPNPITATTVDGQQRGTLPGGGHESAEFAWLFVRPLTTLDAFSN